MASETSYFVQAFNAGRGGNLKADAPIACKTATGALRTAERLALSKLGVVAFSSTGDPELGDSCHWASIESGPATFRRWAGCRIEHFDLLRVGNDGIASATLP
jgi:hypothetical protein